MNNNNLFQDNTDSVDYKNLKPRALEDLHIHEQKIFNHAKKVSLTPEEKSKVFDEFHNFIKTEVTALKSASPSSISSSVNSSVKTPYISTLSAFFVSTSVSARKKVLVPLVVILIFTLTTGTTFAASESLPGDVLYPVKINFNEKIESFLAVGKEARAKVAVQHAVNRLEEAERLEKQGRLDVSTQTYLTEKFNFETKRVDDETNDMRAEGNEEKASNINSDFENKLKIHQEVMLEIQANSNRSSKTKNEQQSNEDASNKSHTVSNLNGGFDENPDKNPDKNPDTKIKGEVLGDSKSDVSIRKVHPNEGVSEIQDAIRLRLIPNIYLRQNKGGVIDGNTSDSKSMQGPIEQSADKTSVVTTKQKTDGSSDKNDSDKGLRPGSNLSYNDPDKKLDNKSGKKITSDETNTKKDDTSSMVAPSPIHAPAPAPTPRPIAIPSAGAGASGQVNVGL